MGLVSYLFIFFCWWFDDCCTTMIIIDIQLYSTEMVSISFFFNVIALFSPFFPKKKKKKCSLWWWWCLFFFLLGNGSHTGIIIIATTRIPYTRIVNIVLSSWVYKGVHPLVFFSIFMLIRFDWNSRRFFSFFFDAGNNTHFDLILVQRYRWKRGIYYTF